MHLPLCRLVHRRHDLQNAKVPGGAVRVVERLPATTAHVLHLAHRARDDSSDAQAHDHVMGQDPWGILEDRGHVAVLHDPPEPGLVTLPYGARDLPLQDFVRVHADEKVHAPRPRDAQDALVAAVQEGPSAVHVDELPGLPRPLGNALHELDQLGPSHSRAGPVPWRGLGQQLGWQPHLAVDAHREGAASGGRDREHGDAGALRSELREPTLADLARPQWIQLVLRVCCGDG
mmetsp:Transcript_107596/g.273117  ORF Transcript_107596/g.273117 Transcript_107596/m.273117 type:complete len:232 (-) Transcript_107596:377-1072(-)